MNRGKPLDEQRRIVAYLDGLQVKVNALRELETPIPSFPQIQRADLGEGEWRI
jgi:hypothetical protein